MSFAQVSVAIALFILIVFLYRQEKAKWQGMVIISVILLILGCVPLLLDKFNPLMRATWVSDNLFRQGGEASILDGGLYGYCVIAVIAGVLLLILAFIKRSRHFAGDDKIDDETDTSSALVRYFRKKLMEEIQKTEDAVGDPIDRGGKDGRSGMPDSRAQEPPQGLFESTTRDSYINLGSVFVRATVAELKQKIESALDGLAQLKAGIDQNDYSSVAAGYYSQNHEAPGVGKIEKIKREVKLTTSVKKEFESNILKHYGGYVQEYDWPKRTTRTQLICLGVFFAVCEFLLSYYLLKDELGERAKLLALLATVVVVILSLTAAFSVQHMRRNNSVIARLTSFLVFGLCLFIVFVGLGLLIGDRQLGTDSSDIKTLSGLLENTRAAYLRMLGSLLDLVLFIINFFAIGFLFYKALHYFEKYSGYDGRNEKAQNALDEYHYLFSANSDEVKRAVDEAKNKSEKNLNSADHYCEKIDDAKTTLHNIQPIITSEYKNYLRPSFAEKIDQYRQNNKSNRSEVQPSPEYFKAGYELCNTNEYFDDCDDIDQFLQANKEKLDEVNDTRAAIQRKSAEWNAAITKFSTEKINEFHEYIENVDIRDS